MSISADLAMPRDEPAGWRGIASGKLDSDLLFLRHGATRGAGVCLKKRETLRNANTGAMGIAGKNASTLDEGIEHFGHGLLRCKEQRGRVLDQPHAHLSQLLDREPRAFASGDLVKEQGLVRMVLQSR